MSSVYEPTEQTTVKRLPAAGVYDREVVHQILDEALICHLGFVVDGQPFVIPTIHVRVDETIYVHGSPASRMLRTGTRRARVCDGDARRRPGTGPIGIPSFHELPLGGRSRNSESLMIQREGSRCFMRSPTT